MPTSAPEVRRIRALSLPRRAPLLHDTRHARRGKASRRHRRAAFLHSSDYRSLAERIRTGEFTDLLSSDVFRNVLFALRQDLDELASRVEEAAAELSKRTPAPETPDGDEGAPKVADETVRATKADVPREAQPERTETIEFAGMGRAGTPSGSLKETCNKAVGALAGEHGINSLALMLRADDSFFPVCTTGVFRKKPPRVSLTAKEIKLLLAATRGESIAVPAGGRTSSKHEEAVELFPLVVGDEIKGALLIGDIDLGEEQREALSAFCREMAMPLEVVRLREELERRMRAATHLQAFTEVVNSAEPDDAYSTILRHSTELLRAERGSLQLYDESTGELAVRAAVGPRADFSRDTHMRLGDGVAGAVLSEGRPVVVRDVAAVPGWHPAPSERSYKTNSFSATNHGRRAQGRRPQRTDKPGRRLRRLDLGSSTSSHRKWRSPSTARSGGRRRRSFQLLSITDPLTGLVNRRYLEEGSPKNLRGRSAIATHELYDGGHRRLQILQRQTGIRRATSPLRWTRQCLKSSRARRTCRRATREEFTSFCRRPGWARRW